MKRLADICEINPRLPRDHGLKDDQQVSFVPMAAVDEVSGRITQGHPRRYGEVKRGYTPFRSGDVLFAKITPCMENGKAAIARELVEGYGFGSTEFHVLRAGPEVMAEWLFYFLRQRTFRHEAKQNFTGSAGQQRVPTTFMSSVIIPIPPLVEQRRRVDILSRAEGIVRLHREALTKTRELIPALFVDMFGDPQTNPKGFSARPLSEVASILSGATKGRKIAPADAVELPYMRVANVQDGHLDLSEIKHITVKANEVEKFRLAPGDLLMTEGGDIDKLGRAALWNGEIDVCLHQNHVFKVRCNKAVVIPEYLRALAGSSYGKAYFLKVAKRTTGIASINKTQLSGLPVLLPPLSGQIAFADRAAEAESIQAQNAASLQRAEAAFQSLLHRAFAARI